MGGEDRLASRFQDPGSVDPRAAEGSVHGDEDDAAASTRAGSLW